MPLSAAYILFGAAILMFEAVRILRSPRFVLTDLDSDLPVQSAINFRALAGGAPLSTSLFLGGGLFFGADHSILLGYLAVVLFTVAAIRLLAALGMADRGKPDIGKQYVAVGVELLAAAMAAALLACA